MVDHRELGGFLKSRRARVTPEPGGADGGPRRRVPGLRREEVARLAGISVEYYVRLEQGRATRPSAEVLDAVARALELDDDERAHLHDLAAPRRRARRTPRPERVRPELAQLLDLFDRVPALVVNQRLDVLAWNRLAGQLFGDFTAVSPKDRNLARATFLGDGADRFGDWWDVARATVAQLRLAAARHTDDEAMATLIGELTLGSEEFRALWAGRDVRERTHGRKVFRHPAVGELTLRFENFDVPGGSGQRVVMLSADPGSPDQAALDLIALWSAPTATAETAERTRTVQA